MKSFETNYLEKHPLPHSLLRTIRVLGEYRGFRTNFKWQTLNGPVRASAARLSIAPFETFARRAKSVALKEGETLFGRKRDQNPNNVIISGGLIML